MLQWYSQIEGASGKLKKYLKIHANKCFFFSAMSVMNHIQKYLWEKLPYPEVSASDQALKKARCIVDIPQLSYPKICDTPCMPKCEFSVSRK